MRIPAMILRRGISTTTAAVVEPGHHILRTVKPESSRKTYLVDRYTHVLRANPILVFVQHNNLSAEEAYNVRTKLATQTDHQAKLTVLRNNLFRVALRGLSHSDPASRAAQRKYKYSNKKNPLDKLLVGPTAAIGVGSIDMDVLDKVMGVVASSQDRLVVLGARIDNRLVDTSGIEAVRHLGTLEIARVRLYQLLSMMGGGQLVSTLESGPQSVFYALHQRHAQLEEDNK